MGDACTVRDERSGSHRGGPKWIAGFLYFEEHLLLQGLLDAAVVCCVVSRVPVCAGSGSETRHAFEDNSSARAGVRS